jgi:hypothetical protein
MALLRVALYSLRAVVSITPPPPPQPKIIQIVYKLLYHCVTIAGDACLMNFETFTTTACSSSNNSTEDGSTVLEYGILCLGAYEGLGRCLQPDISLASSSKNNNYNKNSSAVLSWDELIPLPNNIHESSLSTIMPQQQHIKIIMESGLCASSSILYLSLMSLHTNVRNISMSSSWTVSNDFHFTCSVIYGTCLDDSHQKKEECGTFFQKLLSNVTFPYVMHSIFMGEENNSSSNAPCACLTTDNLRYVKKLFRLLWDGARVIDDLCKINNLPPLRIGCLELQITAIHVILLSLKEVLQQQQHSSYISQSVLKEMFALFDKASSSAMKSSGVFYNAIDKTDTSMESLLLHFHDFIGTQLDKIGTQLCSMTSGGNAVRLLLPASYYEYCVYRSIHRWKLLKSVDGHITTPISTIMISSEDVDSLVGASTLSVIQLALVAMKYLRLDSDVTMTNTECESIISNFERIVIHNSTSISQNRCRSMIILLDLQRETTNIVSQSETPYSAKVSWIALLATILCRCVGALETNMSQSTKDQSRSLNLRLSSADCYAKSASLYHVASEDKSLTTVDHNEYITNADSQLHKSYETLAHELIRMEKNLVHRKSPIVLAIEMFAKVSKRWISSIWHNIIALVLYAHSYLLRHFISGRHIHRKTKI